MNTIPEHAAGTARELGTQGLPVCQPVRYHFRRAE